MATIWTVIDGLSPYLDEAETPVISTFFRVSYGALHRSAWALAVGWLIFACSHGYGGIIYILHSMDFNSQPKADS